MSVRVVNESEPDKVGFSIFPDENQAVTHERIAWKVKVPKYAVLIRAQTDDTIQYLVLKNILSTKGAILKANVKLFFEGRDEKWQIETAKCLMQELVRTLDHSLQNVSAEISETIFMVWESKVNAFITLLNEWNISSSVGSVLQEVQRKDKKERQAWFATLEKQQQIQLERLDDQFSEVLRLGLPANAPPLTVTPFEIQSALVQYQFSTSTHMTIEDLFAQLKSTHTIPWWQFAEWNKIFTPSDRPSSWYRYTHDFITHDLKSIPLKESDYIRFRTEQGECGCMGFQQNQLSVWIRTSQVDPLSDLYLCFSALSKPYFLKPTLRRFNLTATCKIVEDCFFDSFLLSALLLWKPTLRGLIAVRETEVLHPPDKMKLQTVCWSQAMNRNESGKCMFKVVPDVFAWKVAFKWEDVTDEKTLDTLVHLCVQTMQWYVLLHEELAQRLHTTEASMPDVKKYQLNLWDIDREAFPKSQETGCQARPVIVKPEEVQGLDQTQWMEYRWKDRSYHLRCPPMSDVHQNKKFIGFQTIAGDKRREPCCYKTAQKEIKSSKKKTTYEITTDARVLEFDQVGKLPIAWLQLFTAVATSLTVNYKRVGMIDSPWSILDAVLYTLSSEHRKKTEDQRKESVKNALQELLNDKNALVLDQQHASSVSLDDVLAKGLLLNPVDWIMAIEKHFGCNLFLCTDNGWLYPKASSSFVGELMWKRVWNKSVFVWQHPTQSDCMQIEKGNLDTLGVSLRPYFLAANQCFTYTYGSDGPHKIAPFDMLPDAFLMQCRVQILDRYGRCRAVKLRENRYLWCDPMPPLPLPIVEFHSDLFQPTSTSAALEMMETVKRISVCVEHGQVVEQSLQVGSHLFTEVVSYPASELVEEIHRRNRALPRFDKMNLPIQMNRKLARVLTEYLLFLFSSWWRDHHSSELICLSSNRKTTLRLLSEFVQQEMVVDGKDYNVESPARFELSMEQLSIFGAINQDKKWLIKNEEARQKWAYLLYGWVKTHSTKVKDYHKEKRCSFAIQASDWIVPDDVSTSVVALEDVHPVNHQIVSSPSAVRLASFVSHPGMIGGRICMVVNVPRTDEDEKEWPEQQNKEAIRRSVLWNRHTQPETAFMISNQNRVDLTTTVQQDAFQTNIFTNVRKWNTKTDIATVMKVNEMETEALFPLSSAESLKQWVLQLKPTLQ